MAVQHLLAAFDGWREQRKPLVLATIVETLGSTYSKAGTHMLIEPGGDFEGLVSGGCLEGDLVEHARDVLENRRPKLVLYDMRDEEADQVWGLGLGCNGAVRIFLQALDPVSGYEPFMAMSRLMRDAGRGAYALVIAENGAPPASPEWMVAGSAGVLSGSGSGGFLRDYCDAAANAGRVDKLQLDGTELEIFAAPVPVIPRILLLGAGPDVIPLARMGEMLGWRVTVADHRPAYVERLRQVVSAEIRATSADGLSEALNLDSFDACVVMSHHYLTDLGYLRCLAPSRVPYIGMLGPEKRRNRLFEDLGEVHRKLQGRAYGPVGLDIGADDADSIALSIAAQIQAVLKDAGGGHLC
jgi:xanthine dehydrogenase accessory factor